MISVIIGLYDYKYPENLPSVLKSIQNQTTKKEIIFCDHSKKENKYLKNYCQKHENTKYIFIRNNKERGKIAFARNVGALNSSHNFLYFTDADIIFQDKNYFKKILKIVKNNPKKPLIQPSMNRICKNKDKFKEDFIDDEKINFTFRERGFYIYKQKKFEEIPKIVKDVGGVFLACQKKHEKIANEILKKKPVKQEELIWRPLFHWGGIFCRKEIFEKLGGYSLEYSGWGCEDSDFIWKLEKKFGVVKLYKKFPNLFVCHIEHPSKYKTALTRNQKIFNQRVKKPIKNILSGDLKEYDRLSKKIKEDKL